MMEFSLEMALGGSEGGLPYWWVPKSILYDGKKVNKPDEITIPEAMDYSHFKMIKHVYKLNNNFTTKLLQDHPTMIQPTSFGLCSKQLFTM
jgi:hypothetical protein